MRDFAPIEHVWLSNKSELKCTFNDVAGRKGIVCLDIVPSNIVEVVDKHPHDLFFILDHHHTNEVRLRVLSTYPNVRVVFFNGKAASRLLWEHIYPERPIPWVIAYIADRDVWKFELSDSKDINEGLFLLGGTTYESVLEQLDEKSDITYRLAVQVGRQSNGFKEKMILNAMVSAKRYVAMVNGQRRIISLCMNDNPAITSELGHRLSKDPNVFCAMLYKFHYDADIRDGTIVDNSMIWVSLRSRDGVDCSELAKQFGGGGHAQACGFECRSLDFLIPFTAVETVNEQRLDLKGDPSHQS